MEEGAAGDLSIVRPLVVGHSSLWIASLTLAFRAFLALQTWLYIGKDALLGETCAVLMEGCDEFFPFGGSLAAAWSTWSPEGSLALL